MVKLLARRYSALLGLGVALGAAACSAGGSNGSTAARGGGTSSGATSGVGSGNNGSGATGNIDTSTGGTGTVDPECPHVDVNFVPKTPSVFVLVDRSDSMFTPDSTTQVVSWGPLKAGVLDVVKQLEGQVKFGFGAFTGQQGGTCPIFDTIAPALNNSTPISNLYAPLTRVTGAAGETPVVQVLPLLKDLLTEPGNDGDKYVLFVTDGEPDFCDNGDAKCPVDAVVAGVQRLAAEGIHTIVFGLKSSLSNISGETLQAIANAGASLPVAPPFGTTLPKDVCYACQGVPGWQAQWASSANAPVDCNTDGHQTLATYAPTAATLAPVYHPDPGDQAALTAQIASVVSGIKSCTFDLGGQISVNLDLLAQASVILEGQPVPLSPDNGWRMNTDTQLELVGSACATWHAPESLHISFNFPCEIIVVK